MLNFTKEEYENFLYYTTDKDNNCTNSLDTCYEGCQCLLCNTTILPKSMVIKQQTLFNGQPVEAHICIDCANDLLAEAQLEENFEVIHSYKNGNSTWTACSECERGGNGTYGDKCSCGWNVKHYGGTGCFAGIPIEQVVKKLQNNC